MQIVLKKVKKGDFFTLKNLDDPKESQVFVKGDYNRSLKKYECFKFSDVNFFRCFPTNKIVFVDFTF